LILTFKYSTDMPWSTNDGGKEASDLLPTATLAANTAAASAVLVLAAAAEASAADGSAAMAAAAAGCINLSCSTPSIFNQAS